MSVEWKDPDKDGLPDLNRRVLIATPYGWKPAKRVRHGSELHWIDDDARVVWGVVAWAEVVAPNETRR